MTDKELKELVASLAVSHKEMALAHNEMANEFAIYQKKLADDWAITRKETDKQIEQTNQQIKQTNKQLGELGNKWGTFTEGMAIASIQKILSKQFNIPFVAQNLVKRMNGETIEMDAFGYENSTVNTAVIVEIKSHLREDAVEQLEDTMKNFPKFFPDHANKKLFGLIACVHALESVQNILRKKGIYLAVLSDDTFKLHNFKNFIPTDFSQKRA